MKKKIIGLAVLLLLFGFAGSAKAATLEVPAQYPTIQAAIDAAAAGDDVLVAPGEYVESITLKSGVTVQSSGGPEVTTIRGDGTWIWREGYTYTVYGADNSTISGFTITGSLWGIINYRTATTITHNILANNGVGFANGTGAGVYNYGYGSSAVITGNVISGNFGYGIYNDWTETTVPTIANNIISGSPLGVGNYYATSIVTNNLITGCETGVGDAMFYPSTITNNTVAGSLDYGIFIESDSVVTNNIVAGNDNYGVYVYTPNIENYTTSPIITYNNIWGNLVDIADYGTNTTLANNISADPLFLNPFASNYRLGIGSPCTDAGTNDAPGLTATDLDGNPRIADDNGDYAAVVDMGAYEGAFESPCTPEIKHDGIDQDCNGYDLTIDIIEASYAASQDKLYVEAASSLGALANLTLDGYGPMAWVSNKSIWTITVKRAGGNPGTVTVSGVEGSESSPVTVN